MRASLSLVFLACPTLASADITLLEEARTFGLSAQGQSDFGSGGDSFSALSPAGAFRHKDPGATGLRLLRAL